MPRTIVLLILALLTQQALGAFQKLDWDIIPSFHSLLRKLPIVDGALWRGTAPFCKGGCAPGETYVDMYDGAEWTYAIDTDFGEECLLDTQKALCTSDYSSCAREPDTVTLPINCSILIDSEGAKEWGARYASCSWVNTTPELCSSDAARPIMLKAPYVALDGVFSQEPSQQNEFYILSPSFEVFCCQ